MGRATLIHEPAYAVSPPERVTEAVGRRRFLGRGRFRPPRWSSSCAAALHSVEQPYRELQVAPSIRFRLRQGSRVDVDLYALKNQIWRCERRVSLLAEFDKSLLGRIGAELYVVPLRLTDRRFIGDGSSSRLVVVAHEHTRFIRQDVELLGDRVVQGFGASRGKVASTRTVVRHEHRVAREERISNLIGGARGGVPRRMDGFDRQAPDRKFFSIGDQLVELTAVGRKVFRQVEDIFEGFLNGRDEASNDDGGAQLFLQGMGARQMIGVRMRLQDCADFESLAVDKSQYIVDRFRGYTDGQWIVVQYRIDDDGIFGCPVVNDIGQGKGSWVKKSFGQHSRKSYLPRDFSFTFHAGPCWGA